MTNNPRVSIITPSFNRAYIIEETAESIFKQTYQNWEWVIVDDGSTDNSWEVLQGYAAADDRVKVYKRDRGPKGACTCRNIAINNCTGDYLIFLDTDDLLASFCLEQRVKAAQENGECDFVIFPMLLFKKTYDDMRVLWNVDTGEDDLYRVLVGDPICQGTGTIWKKESFVKMGMWREDLQLWQDVELHIRSFIWPMKYVKKMELSPDVFLRVSDDSLSRVGYFSVPKMESRISVYLDACKQVIEKGLLQKYNTGIRIMGVDVIVSAIKSRHFIGANKTIAYCYKNNIFNAKEIIQFFLFIYAHKLKLYKILWLYTFVGRYIMNIANSKEMPVFLGKMHLKEKVDVRK